jgi:hypothetical protein
MMIASRPRSFTSTKAERQAMADGRDAGRLGQLVKNGAHDREFVADHLSNCGVVSRRWG